MLNLFCESHPVYHHNKADCLKKKQKKKQEKLNVRSKVLADYWIREQVPSQVLSESQADETLLLNLSLLVHCSQFMFKFTNHTK